MERKGTDAAARRLLNEVAADLAKTKWAGRLKTTEDFVVFATDFEGADRRKNMRKTVPPKRMAAFKRTGLV